MESREFTASCCCVSDLDRLSHFIVSVVPFLCEHRAENHMLLQILLALQKGHAQFHVFAVSRIDPRSPEEKSDEIPPDLSSIFLVGVLEVPWHLILSYAHPSTPDCVFESLIDCIQRQLPNPLPGAVGEKGTVDRFAGKWCQKLSARPETSYQEVMYSLVGSDLREPRRPSEDAAAAESIRFVSLTQDDLIPTDSDRTDSLVSVVRQAIEVFGDPRSPAEILQVSSFALVRGEGSSKHYLSFCHADVPTGLSFARLSFVFTPPEHRRRGYASWVAYCACKKRFEDESVELVCLHAEKSNTSTNRMYQRLGFRPIGDFDLVLFRYE